MSLSEPPLVTSEGNSTVTCPVSCCSAPDYVVVDIPEPDMTYISPVRESTDLITTDPEVTDTDNVTSESPESEATSIRRPVWERRLPHKLTYDELGEPLTLAISSFFQALGTAISNIFACGGRCACRDSCSLEGENVTLVS